MFWMCSSNFLTFFHFNRLQMEWILKLWEPHQIEYLSLAFFDFFDDLMIQQVPLVPALGFKTTGQWINSLAYETSEFVVLPKNVGNKRWSRLLAIIFRHGPLAAFLDSLWFWRYAWSLPYLSSCTCWTNRFRVYRFSTIASLYLHLEADLNGSAVVPIHPNWSANWQNWHHRPVGRVTLGQGPGHLSWFRLTVASGQSSTTYLTWDAKNLWVKVDLYRSRTRWQGLLMITIISFNFNVFCIQNLLHHVKM